MKSILNDMPDNEMVFQGNNNIKVKGFYYVPADGMLSLISEKVFIENGINKGLVTLCSNDPREFRSDALFASAVDLFLDHKNLLFYGGVTPNLGPVFYGSELTRFYVTDPYIFDNEQISEQYYWIFPISEKETKFLSQVGPEHFEEHLLGGEKPVFVFDYKRKSSM